MKRLLFILAVMAFAVGCTDKPEFETPGADVPQTMTLVYDTAQIDTSDPDTQYAQTLNRVDDFYRVGGKFVRLTMYLDADGVYYLTATRLVEDDDEDVAAGLMLDCEFAKIEGNFSNPSQINVRSVNQSGEYDFDWRGDLPDADVALEPTEGQPENVTMYREAEDAHPAYVIRYVDGDGVVQFGFVFTVKSIEATETMTEESIPSGKPFEEPTIVEVPQYSTSMTLLYKAFDKNFNWVN